MVGTLAQLIAIISYGNAALIGRSSSLPHTNSTFQFCNRIEFVATQRNWFTTREQLVADSPDRWFAYLRNQECKGLRLVYLSTKDTSVPEHMMAGLVGGGGRWLIAADTKDRSDYWEGDWQVTAKDAPDRRIWSVRYRRVAAPQIARRPPAELPEVSRELRGILTEIRDFAQRQNLDNFAKCFLSGLDCLESDNPLAQIYHTDLVPSDWYSLPAQRLLAACSVAWVFGGMGSWNDLGFAGEDNATYEKLSKMLYAAIINGIVSATNSKLNDV
jgi:hypothetical protein